MGRAKRGEAWATFEHLSSMETDECVLWPFATHAFGYGMVSVPGSRKVTTVHRLALERRLPPPPGQVDAAHGPCHNPACLNYRHLRWASRKENEQDKLRDGTHQWGERNHMARLSFADVQVIRSMSSASEAAAAFGISLSHARDIIAGRKRVAA